MGAHLQANDHDRRNFRLPRSSRVWRGQRLMQRFLSPEPRFEGVNSEQQNQVGLQNGEACCGPRSRAFSLPPPPLDVGSSPPEFQGRWDVNRHTGHGSGRSKLVDFYINIIGPTQRTNRVRYLIVGILTVELRVENDFSCCSPRPITHPGRE